MKKSKKQQIEESVQAFIDGLNDQYIDPRVIEYTCDGVQANYNTYGYYGSKKYEDQVVCNYLRISYKSVRNSEKILSDVQAGKMLIQLF